jgi:predicted nucleotide-binding protein
LLAGGILVVWVERGVTPLDYAKNHLMLQEACHMTGSLDPDRAANELRKLRAEAGEPDVRRTGPAHKAWKAKSDALMEAGLGRDSETLRSFRDLRYHVGISTGAPGEGEEDARYFAKRVDDAAALIDAAIYQLDLQTSGQDVPVTSTRSDGPIFIVHGRDDGRKYELLRLLEKTVHNRAIVLHEQPNSGATILEKFLRHAEAASFAVVLLTADDEGRLRGSDDQLKPRGRQNVILELGIFVGQLGRARVAVLKDADVEVPSDLNGLVYIALDPAGAWRHDLLKELQAAGIDVDFEQIP